ncbi:putative pentatricopeptide repeat-containing protein [Tripterygium wilfordii]|uniref:Putative pentatricopeptide repeat-containing protein n=1 Tax=Tripterygium wilfordii TaxID=458696 RepID=A0A7J7C560_TRIWF|nr:putative pentatricopeptide repeat-containing protein [Tripterygium wilfordii]
MAKYLVLMSLLAMTMLAVAFEPSPLQDFCVADASSSRTNSTISIDQILSKAITTSLIYATPTWNCIVRAYSKSPTPVKYILIDNYFIQIITPTLLCSRHVTKVGLDNDIFVGNAFLHLYGTLKELCDACTLFDGMPDKDVASWN